MQVVVGGKVLGDGKASFQHILHICVENLCRDKAMKKPSAITTKKGKGTVGVLIEQYHPSMTEADEVTQVGLREHLQNYHLVDERLWQWKDIHSDMQATYKLQRDDIEKAKAAVVAAQESANSRDDASDSGEKNDSMEDDNIMPDAAMKVVKEKWPFLFTVPCLRNHHQRLTGREINKEMMKFCESYFEYTYLYMTCGSRSNTQNISIRLRIESKCEDMPSSSKLLACVVMIANHFEEDWSSLILSAEVCN